MKRSSLFRAALVTLSFCGLGCDPTLPTEFDQVAIDPGLEFFGRYASPVAVLEGSVACFTYLGYRSDEDDAQVVDADHEELRACYSEALSGPASFDEGACIAFEGPGAVRWDATREPCGLGPKDLFGDDVARFDVLSPADVQAAFELAVPLEVFLEGATHRLDGLEQLSVPEGIVAAPGEPIRVLEGGIDRLRVSMMNTGGTRLVGTSDPMVFGEVSEATDGVPDIEADATSVAFDAEAGDIIDVALDTAAGRFEVGEVHIVSADQINSMSLHPRVVREVGTDGFWALGAVAVARDAGGHILRGPAVRWEVLEGDVEVSARGAGEEARERGEGPEVSVVDPCGGATASSAERSAVLQAHLGELSETVRVEWTCVQLQDEGCACQASEGDGARDRGLLLGLFVFGIALRARRRRRSAAAC